MKSHISFRVRMGYCLLTFSIVTFGVILGGKYYQLFAETVNWINNFLNSSTFYYGFFKVSQSGYFFQKTVSLTILCLSVAIILLWNTAKTANKWLLIAFAGILISEVFTVLYFIPRTFAIFLNPFSEISAEQLQQIGTGLQKANHFRLVMVTLTMIAFLKAEEILFLNMEKAPKLKEEELALS